jgi:hypothetical protein
MKSFRRFVILCSLATLPAVSGHAQSFLRGDNLISVGLAAGSSLGNFHFSSSSPGLALQYELGYLNLQGPGVLGLGCYLGHKGYSNSGISGPYSYSQEWSYTVIGFRGAYHYNGIPNLKQLDPYGGVMVSYNAVNYSYSGSDGLADPGSNYDSGLGLSAYLGGRWFFTKNIAAYMELGLGVSNIAVGACYKF